jgi:hypothetical protein
LLCKGSDTNISLFRSLYDKFVLNGADIIIQEDAITVQLKKKRNLPLLLEAMQSFSRQKYPWLIGKNVIFKGATYS